MFVKTRIGNKMMPVFVTWNKFCSSYLKQN